jgi:hypothetical protein
MVGPSKTLALNNRALQAAGWLEFWADRLQEIPEEQNVNLGEDPIDVLRGRTDDSITITLKRGEVRNLITGMHDQIAELRRYAQRRKKPIRRSPPGFTP